MVALCGDSVQSLGDYLGQGAKHVAARFGCAQEEFVVSDVVLPKGHDIPNPQARVPYYQRNCGSLYTILLIGIFVARFQNLAEL